MKCGHCKAKDVDIAHVRSHTQSTTSPGAPNWSGEKPAVPDASLPPLSQPTSTGWSVGQPLPFPEGRYAILAGAMTKDDVKFYKIDAPTEGRWAGYVFVKTQASDDLYPVRSRSAREEIINTIIEQGWKECLLRYGREIGKCGHCGRTLTNKESRAYGIGPICRRDPKFAAFV